MNMPADSVSDQKSDAFSTTLSATTDVAADSGNANGIGGLPANSNYRQSSRTMSMQADAASDSDQESDAFSTTLSATTDVDADSGNANGIGPLPANFEYSLPLIPLRDYNPDNYENLESEFPPLFFRAMEPHLPTNLLNATRETKVAYMVNILRLYWKQEEGDRVKWHKEYRQNIISKYQPLYRELYQLEPTNFFVPSFLNAFMAKDDTGIRNIMSEPSPGIYTFEMLQPRFCEMMLAEVEYMEKWLCETETSIMRPNTMNKYGFDLADFGMGPMIEKLMQDFIRHISKIFFADVGGASLDSYHGYVVEYGLNRDVELGFHVDDSEVTLNVCLGKQFSGGDLFFRGVRCEKHVNTKELPQEMFDYSHVPGHVVIHRGRHRHGARPTTSGHRVNLLIWCRSSVSRKLCRVSKDYTRWCGECQREKKEKLHRAVAKRKAELLVVVVDNLLLD